MVAALLGTTPRLKPRSSANDLAPPLCMGLVSLRHARARSARNKSQCCGGLTTAGPEPDLYRRLPRPSSHGTLLHFSLQSSRLNICYYHQDLHLRRLHPGSRPKLQCSPQRPSYSSRHGTQVLALPRRSGIGPTLQRHPFSGLVDSAGELLHTP